MTSRLLAVLIIFPIWLTLVLVFRRHRQWLLYYLVAAFGLTIQIVFLAEYFGIDQLLINMASFHVELISKFLFKLPIELLSNGRFLLTTPDGDSNILKLGIECSAVLESSIIFSLIIFYPLFNWSQKLIRVTFGLIMTYAINIVRLMIIVLMADKFGSDYIFLAHAGVARIFFFICELLLYWYLLTKPTVKSVGDAVKDGVNVSQTALVGKSLRLKHSIAQLSVIILVVLTSFLSFRLSDDWKKSFANLPVVERPIIYKDETEMIPVEEPIKSSINQEIVLNLLGNEKTLIRLVAQKEEKLNIQVPQGEEDFAARLLLNGEELSFIISTPWRYTKLQSVFEPVAVKPGDVLEIKFQNLAEDLADYLVKVFPTEGQESQMCQFEEPQMCKLEEMPASQTKTAPTIAGVAVKSIEQEIVFNLAGGEKTLFKFEAQKEEKLNIQVPFGEEDLAARVIINGHEFGFITSTPWRYMKQEAIFKPISVKPGDVLEIRLQNLAEEPSSFLLKIFPIEGQDGQ